MNHAVPQRSNKCCHARHRSSNVTMGRIPSQITRNDFTNNEPFSLDTFPIDCNVANRTNRNLFWIILHCFFAFVTCYSHATVRVLRPGLSSTAWPYRKDSARLGGCSLTHPTTNIFTTTISTQLWNSFQDLAVAGVFGLTTGPVVETVNSVTVKLNSPENTDPFEIRSTLART